VAIPKTMDNDVHGTDYCIGFSTAVTRSVNFIHSLRTSTGSHERIAVIELFGRYCGETSLIAAYLASVDRAIISEVPFDPEKLARLIMEDKQANPSNYAMLTISEGARMVSGEVLLSGEADAYGHRKLGGIGIQTGVVLKKLTGQNIINQQLSYLMRSGAPDSLDLMVAVNFANMAIDLVLKKVSGRMHEQHYSRAKKSGRSRTIRCGTIPSKGPPCNGKTDVSLLGSALAEILVTYCPSPSAGCVWGVERCKLSNSSTWLLCSPGIQ
jgi:6-phosphofructokinase 1